MPNHGHVLWAVVRGSQIWEKVCPRCACENNPCYRFVSVIRGLVDQLAPWSLLGDIADVDAEQNAFVSHQLKWGL